MKKYKTIQKVCLVVSVSIMILGVVFVYAIKGINNAVGFNYYQSTTYNTIEDNRIPTDKCFKVTICTYDNPEKLMDKSYVEFTTLDGKILKSQYFNGQTR